MTRNDLKLLLLSGFVILAVVLFATFRLEVEQVLRQVARSDALRGPYAATIAGPATVIDGDTLEIRGQRIRLFGIDAPESGQSCTDADGKSYRCGQRATQALSDRIGRSPVTCHQHDTDRYRRMVAVCMLGSLDLDAWMVLNGHALAYRKYSTGYVAQETIARHEKRGIWAGDFVAPWDWRRAQR